MATWSSSPDAVQPLPSPDINEPPTDHEEAPEESSNIVVYLEEIARLRRELQGAQKLADHRLQVIFDLQDAAARLEQGGKENKPEEVVVTTATTAPTTTPSLSTKVLLTPPATNKSKLLNRTNFLTLRDPNPSTTVKEGSRAGSRSTARAGSVMSPGTSASQAIKRISRSIEKKHVDPVNSTPIEPNAVSGEERKIRKAHGTVPQGDPPLEERPKYKEERTVLTSARKKRTSSSAGGLRTSSASDAPTRSASGRRRPPNMLLKRLPVGEGGEPHSARRSRTGSARVPRLAKERLDDGADTARGSKCGTPRGEEVPVTAYRLRSLQERYESAKVSLALLRGLVLRSDSTLYSLLSRFNSTSRPEKIFQTTLATLRGIIIQSQPEVFQFKVREGALWLFNSEEMCFLEECSLPGVLPVLRELIASHDWIRRSNRGLFRSNNGVAVGMGEMNFGTALESSFFEFYVNLHILLTIAQSGSVSKQIG